MQNTITTEVQKVANKKAKAMPLGTYSRLKIDGVISDLVIQPSSSGIYFFYVPGTISKEISNQQIGFMYYGELAQ